MQEEACRVRLARRLDFDAGRLAVSYQVHGKDIHVIRKLEDVPVSRAGGIDGWAASGSRGVSLGVFGADCLPLFLLSLDEPVGALLHVGWRGLEKGIVDEGIEVLKSVLGVPSQRLSALAGPHVRVCCYSVGEDVACRFPETWLTLNGDKKFLDIAAGVAAKLSAAGVESFCVSSDCTRCSDPSLFFSHRRQDKGAQLAVLTFS